MVTSSNTFHISTPCRTFQQSSKASSPQCSRSSTNVSPISVVISRSAPRLKHPIPITDGLDMSQPARQTRVKPRISYEISSDSDTEGFSRGRDSSFSSPEKRASARNEIIDVESDSSEVEEMESRLPAPRTTSAGHSLRQRNELQQSLRARENADKRKLRTKKRAQGAHGKSNAPSNSRKNATRMTDRSEIRQGISSTTARKRANFFVAKSNVFLPLLPSGNYLEKLITQKEASGQLDPDAMVPYANIKNQPAG